MISPGWAEEKLLSSSSGATSMSCSHTHPDVPAVTVPGTDLPLHREVRNTVLLLLPQNHTAMLQQESIAQCSSHLGIKKLMEKLDRATNHHESMFAYVCCIFAFFWVCLLVFEGERDSNFLMYVAISVSNATVCCHTSAQGEEKRNLHLPSPAFHTHPFVSDSSRTE